MKPPTRILIVEDDLDTARHMCMVMAALYGHDVAVANDSRSALNLAQVTSPDFVLLDLGVPKYDQLGLGLRKALGPHPVFISVSTKAKRLAGIDLQFVKPLNLDEMNTLLTQIRGWDKRPANRVVRSQTVGPSSGNRAQREGRPRQAQERQEDPAKALEQLAHTLHASRRSAQ
jgi:DNA-binding response OmpR family regulator